MTEGSAVCFVLLDGRPTVLRPAEQIDLRSFEFLPPPNVRNISGNDFFVFSYKYFRSEFGGVLIFLTPSILPNIFQGLRRSDRLDTPVLPVMPSTRRL